MAINAKTLIGANGMGGVGASTTRYWSMMTGNPALNATESQTQITYRTGGVLSNLWLYVNSNTTTITASTLQVRLNAANGNGTISVAAGTTGTFEDTVNTDTIAAGDKLDYSFNNAAASGVVNVTDSSVLFAATTNTVIIVGNAKGNFNTDSNTSYFALAGAGQGSAQATEARAQFDFNTSGTFANFFINIVSNARTSTTTYRTRLAGSNGNLVLSVTSGTTGIVEDTSHTDSVAVNTLCNLSINTGSGAFETITATLKIEFTTTDGTFWAGTGSSSSSGNTLSTGLTRYGTFWQPNVNNSTESDSQLKAGVATTASHMWLYISGNATTSASSITLRKNAGNGADSISIGIAATGTFEDTTGNDTIIATDLVDIRMVNGGGGTITYWGRSITLGLPNGNSGDPMRMSFGF